MALNPATPCQGDLGSRPSMRRKRSLGVRAGLSPGSRAGSVSPRYRVPSGVGCNSKSGASPEIAYQRFMLIRSTQVGVIFVVETLSERPMRASNLAIVAVALVAACAHYVETSSPTETRWEQRDISELIAAIGPFDTTSIR